MRMNKPNKTLMNKAFCTNCCIDINNNVQSTRHLLTAYKIMVKQYKYVSLYVYEWNVGVSCWKSTSINNHQFPLRYVSVHFFFFHVLNSQKIISLILTIFFLCVEMLSNPVIFISFSLNQCLRKFRPHALVGTKKKIPIIIFCHLFFYSLSLHFIVLLSVHWMHLLS